MPNLASVLKDEIARIARKEIRRQTGVLQKASAQYRRDIAALKRKVTSLERSTALLESQVLKDIPAPEPEAVGKSLRITTKGIVALRRKLGLSAADMAKLAGVSAQSIYGWEAGKTKPRKDQAARLIALRGMGRKEARARLSQVS